MTLPSTARVVVIGGGAVGTSILYHLTRRGWSDVLLLEKSELTAGSTWHAAGNCPTFHGHWSMMRLQAYGIDLYERLGEDVGYPINYHQTGAVRLAHTPDRMREFRRVADMAHSQGREMDPIGVDDLKARAPWLETHDLVGGLWDPRDGDIDPSQLTQAYATGARAGGATIIRGAPVTGVARTGGEWVVSTPQGALRCETVVNAAGYYAPDIAAHFLPHGGRMPPQTVMAHQYLVTEEIPELRDAAAPMPMIRDPDSSYYLRQEKHGLLLGPYENGGRIHWRASDDTRPDDFSFQLFPDDLDRIEPYIEDACARVPLLGSVGVLRVINGPIPYAPDGLPLLGAMPGVRNAFEAIAFTFGIIQSGGAGKAMAEMIVDGETEWDLWALDPRRFTAYADQAYADAKGKEVYDNEYAIQYPRYQWPRGRDRRRSALHDRLTAAGAQFGPVSGWERAMWFAGPDDDTDPRACATYARRGPWFHAVARECAAVRDGCGVLDLTGFARFRLTGAGAAAWLDGQITGRLPKVGRVALAYVASETGRFAAEMTLARAAADDFLLITAAVAEWRDAELLRASLPAGLTLTDVTEDHTVLLVTGPRARAALAGVIDADLALPWMSRQTATLDGAAFDLMRVSFAGELGWELHLPAGLGPGAWDAITAAGATPVGMYALDALRLEKGYPAWGKELATDRTLLSLGVDRFVRLDKPAFPGKAAMASERQRGPARRLASLTLDSPDFDPCPGASVWAGARRVGLVTSAGWGHRTGQAIALAMLDADADGPLRVDVFGDRRPAAMEPALCRYDPQNERLRA